MELDKQNLIWIDLEMTGLDPEKERIIEIATIVTDKNLNILAEGPVLAVHQPDELLNKMSEWCVKTHTANGLVERVKVSKLNERDGIIRIFLGSASIKSRKSNACLYIQRS